MTTDTLTFSPLTTPWVWIDLDDTLWDFTGNSRSTLTRMYATEGLDRWFASPEEWIERYESHNTPLWRLYNVGAIKREMLLVERFRRPLAQMGAPCDSEEARRLNDLYLQQLGTHPGLVDGARELLAHLRSRGYSIGIISNGFKEVQFRKLQSAGVLDMIDLVVLSDDIGVNKPSRRLFDHALKRANATAEQSVLIGDNPDTDILGALGAGWQAIMLDRGSADTRRLPPNVPVVTSLHHLINCF